MPIDEIGKIKEGPCLRYMEGQSLMDKKFKKEAQRVEKRRAKNEEKARRILQKAAEKGLFDPNRSSGGKGVVRPEGKRGMESNWEDMPIYGPTDLQDETPPPSAIAGRRDTEDAIALLRTSLHIKATEYNGGKQADLQDLKGAPAQSAAERQIEKGAPGAKYGLRGFNGE